MRLAPGVGGRPHGQHELHRPANFNAQEGGHGLDGLAHSIWPLGTNVIEGITTHEGHAATIFRGRAGRRTAPDGKVGRSTVRCPRPCG